MEVYFFSLKFVIVLSLFILIEVFFLFEIAASFKTMSIIRATKAYQTEPISSSDIHSSKSIEKSHSHYDIENYSKQGDNRDAESKRIFQDNAHAQYPIDSNNDQLNSEFFLEQKMGTKTISSQENDTITSVEEQKDPLEVLGDENYSEEENHKKINRPSTQGVVKAINCEAPVSSQTLGALVTSDTMSLPVSSQTLSALGTSRSFESSVTDESKEDISNVLSAAMQSLSTSSFLDQSPDSMSESSKSKFTSLEEAPGFSNSSLSNQSISNFKNEGSLGSSDALGGKIPTALASAIRTGNISTFLSELTATVAQARLNSANGQNITFQLRSDVLDATTVHINANKQQMEVAFSTSSAASNTMLNNNITTLQNHLVALCPGQSVEVKTEFRSSSNSSEFSNQKGTEDDFAGLNQKNRGRLSDDKDTL